MAKIAYVKAWGLWSHLETIFEFSPGLTVITGPNGSGKSTLIRIVKWVALGEPAGEDFIFQLKDNATGEVLKQAEEGKAEIGLDNGIVITKKRRKGKTTYTINTIPEPFEKAEVPQEVKDALGISKYSFGDFETYLNFAFQMEAPFLISETPSVGAKVLGKLAGTEAVDLAISEISKRTHKARDERRVADKEVERINGSLLEYQDIDELKEQVGACEYLISEVDRAASRKDNLVNMVNTLTTANENVSKLNEELAALEVVPLAGQVLHQIEQAQQRYELRVNEKNQLEASVRTVYELTNQLALYEGIDKAASTLAELEAKTQRLYSIKSMSTEYKKYTNTIITCKEILGKLTNIDVAAADLTIYEKKEDKLQRLRQLNQGFTAVKWDIDMLNISLESLQEIGAAADCIKNLSVAAEQLDKLNQIYTEYANRCIVVAGIDTEVKIANNNLEKAQQELTAAWEATGGICPLCEQPVSTHKH